MLEDLLAIQNRFLDLRIVWNHASGYRHRRLIERGRSDIGAGEFIFDAIAIIVSVQPKALAGLHPVVLIKRSIGKLTQRNYIAGLMPRTKYESRPVDRGWGDDTQARQTFYS